MPLEDVKQILQKDTSSEVLRDILKWQQGV